MQGHIPNPHGQGRGLGEQHFFCPFDEGGVRGVKVDAGNDQGGQEFAQAHQPRAQQRLVAARAQDETHHEATIGGDCDQQILEFTAAGGHVVGLKFELGNESGEGGHGGAQLRVKDGAGGQVHALPLSVKQTQRGRARRTADGHFRFGAEVFGGRGRRRKPGHVGGAGDAGQEVGDCVLAAVKLLGVCDIEVRAGTAQPLVEVVAKHSDILSRPAGGRRVRSTPALRARTWPPRLAPSSAPEHDPHARTWQCPGRGPWKESSPWAYHRR